MLDFAFAAHPHLKNIVEFGTYLGVTSLHLAQMAALRGGEFHSFDISDLRLDFAKEAWSRMGNMNMHLVDLLKTPPDEAVKDVTLTEETFFFFDNGDKAFEINTFLEYIGQWNDAAFCTHDWEVELTMEDIQASLRKHAFKPFAFDHAEMLGSHVRCFTKKDLRGIDE